VDIEPKFITPGELQGMLGCGRTFCYALLSRGEIPSYKIGKLRRIALGDVLAYLEANKYAPGAGSEAVMHTSLAPGRPGRWSA
jgi:excisionase family DNA binding protein